MQTQLTLTSEPKLKLKSKAPNRRALSEMLAVIIILAMTIVAGAFVYETFFNKANSYANTAALSIDSATISNNMLVMTVKNSGSMTFTSLSVSVYTGGSVVLGPSYSFSPSSLSPGQTSVYTGSLSESVGATYLITVEGVSSSAGNVVATVSIVGS